MADRPMTDRDRLGLAVWDAFRRANGQDPAGYVPINMAGFAAAAAFGAVRIRVLPDSPPDALGEGGER